MLDARDQDFGIMAPYGEDPGWEGMILAPCQPEALRGCRKISLHVLQQSSKKKAAGKTMSKSSKCKNARTRGQTSMLDFLPAAPDEGVACAPEVIQID